MVHILQNYSLADRRMAAMFEDRKCLFVDTLGWDVPVVGERYEMDAFDGPGATYLIATGEDETHAGSMRLLPTEKPHILGTLFPDLCDGPVPTGNTVFELTRLGLPSRLGAARRRKVRDRLISAMLDHAHGHGISALTGVVAWTFLEQILAMGWQSRPLGKPRECQGVLLGAFRIDLDSDTIAGVTATGIYHPGAVAAPLAQVA